jgi:hypothetical protein
MKSYQGKVKEENSPSLRIDCKRECSIDCKRDGSIDCKRESSIDCKRECRIDLRIELIFENIRKENIRPIQNTQCQHEINHTQCQHEIRKESVRPMQNIQHEINFNHNITSGTNYNISSTNYNQNLSQSIQFELLANELEGMIMNKDMKSLVITFFSINDSQLIIHN